jgi:hypothetical protein
MTPRTLNSEGEIRQDKGEPRSGSAGPNHSSTPSPLFLLLLSALLNNILSSICLRHFFMRLSPCSCYTAFLHFPPLSVALILAKAPINQVEARLAIEISLHNIFFMLTLTLQIETTLGAEVRVRSGGQARSHTVDAVRLVTAEGNSAHSA